MPIQARPFSHFGFDRSTLTRKNSVVKARAEIKVNGRTYHKGDALPWIFVYAFFLVHMLAFGGSGFFMAYSSDGPGLGFLFLHGGFAIAIYLVFYLAIFGLDEVRWMFINAGLGLFGIYAQINLLLSLFGKRAADYPPVVHLIPFLYYVLYTFLLYQLVLDVSGAREDARRKRMVEALYVAGSLLVYGVIYLTQR